VESLDAHLQQRVEEIVGRRMAENTREWFDYEAAADYLCTSVESLRMECKRRRLQPSRKRPTIFHRDELRRWARG
jgi:hypothetical protein